jgi:hypothetical protein
MTSSTILLAGGSDITYKRFTNFQRSRLSNLSVVLIDSEYWSAEYLTNSTDYAISLLVTASQADVPSYDGQIVGVMGAGGRFSDFDAGAGTITPVNQLGWLQVDQNPPDGSIYVPTKKFGVESIVIDPSDVVFIIWHGFSPPGESVPLRLVVAWEMELL